jgi:hypothetical protein
MSTLTAHRSATDLIAAHAARRASKRAGVVEEYVPSSRQAARSAQRIAMQARREQDRWQRGW